MFENFSSYSDIILAAVKVNRKSTNHNLHSLISKVNKIVNNHLKVIKFLYIYKFCFLHTPYT